MIRGFTSWLDHLEISDGDRHNFFRRLLRFLCGLDRWGLVARLATLLRAYARQTMWDGKRYREAAQVFLDAADNTTSNEGVRETLRNLARTALRIAAQLDGNNGRQREHGNNGDRKPALQARRGTS